MTEREVRETLPDPTEAQLQSASIKVTLSNAVGTAALAVLAGAVAVFTLVQQYLHPHVQFYAPMFAGVLVLVTSIFLGGKGAGQIARTLGDGMWRTTTGRVLFNWQSGLALFGLCLVLLATALGVLTSSASPPPDPCTKVLAADLRASHPSISELRHDLIVCEATRP